MTWIPNALTLARLVSVIPLVYFLWHERIYLSLMILVAAGITDLLDGYLAREFGWKTPTGAWLDPAADKTLITTVMITLTLKGYVPIWFCLLALFRDLGLVGGLLYLMKCRIPFKIQPHISGKLATATQILVLLLAMLYVHWPLAKLLIVPALLVAALITVVSAINYGMLLAEKISSEEIS